jgi:hypothetical protein
MSSSAASNNVQDKTVTSGAPAEDATALLMTAAFERVKPKAASIPAGEVMEIRVPVGDMIQTIVGTLSQLHAHREEIVRVGDCDITHLDNLEDYIYALGYLYSRMREASGRPSIKTVEQLVASRQLFHAHATALAYSGFFDKDRVARLNRGKSYQDLAYDVVGITNLFLENWPALEQNTMITRAQLVQAQAAATTLIRTLGEREQKPGDRAELSLLYRQVYTLAYVAYNEVREALAYARRHEKDVATIAPSLHEDQGRRKGGGESIPTPEAGDDGETEVEALTGAQTGEAPLPPLTAPPLNSNGATGGPIAPVARPGFPGSSSVLREAAEA